MTASRWLLAALLSGWAAPATADGIARAPSDLPSEDELLAAAHIFSGRVTEIGPYECEPGDEGEAAFETCRVTVVVAPDVSYNGRIAPAGPIPVLFSFEARSYGPAAGDDLSRIAAGLEPDVLLLAEPGQLIAGQVTLQPLAAACPGATFLALTPDRRTILEGLPRFVPNPEIEDFREE